MNILHISPYYPSLLANHAGGITMGREIESLREQHRVCVLSFAASRFDRKIIREVRREKGSHAVYISRLTRLFHVLTNPSMPAHFSARSSFRFSLLIIYFVLRYRIDAVHAEYSAMGQYIWVKKLFPRLSFNLTLHDVTFQSYYRKYEEALGLKKLFFKRELKLIKEKEGKYSLGADTLFTFNEKDRRLIARLYGRDDTLVLHPYFGETKGDPSGGEAEKDPYRICFVGQMGRLENYEAALRLVRIAGSVRKSLPHLNVYIVGSEPPEELKSLANDYIHVTGYVEDVDIYIRSAALAVFPLTLGAGIKVKVLRSLALGTPVITGRVGAEGIDEAGSVIIFAESDEEYIEKIIYQLTHPEELNALAKESRAYIEKNFCWDESERVLMSVYGEQRQL